MELEEEISEMKLALEGPCSKESCLAVVEQLKQVR